MTHGSEANGENLSFLFLSLAVLLCVIGILHGVLPQHFIFAGGEAFRGVSKMSVGTSFVPGSLSHLSLDSGLLSFTDIQ